MQIVWDEPKRQSNLIKHEMDFRTLTSAFFDTAVLRHSRAER